MAASQLPGQPPPYDGGSSSCDGSGSYYAPCGHSLSMASVVALVCVSAFFFLLLCWCATRLYTATRTSRPFPSLSSLCRRSNPQIHLPLHSTDSPTSSSTTAPHPSSSSLFPFRGHYRIGANQHLSPFRLLLRFDFSAYPRALVGHGVDDSIPFTLSDGLFSVEGGEYRCQFTERFDDGSRYQFSGVSEQGQGSAWRGHWWKEGGDQAGVWAMKPDDDRWAEMQTRAPALPTTAQAEGGADGRGGGAGEERPPALRVRTEPIQRWDLEERKEVRGAPAFERSEEKEQDAQRSDAVTRREGPADIEMVALQPLHSERAAQPLAVEISVEA